MYASIGKVYIFWKEIVQSFQICKENYTRGKSQAAITHNIQKNGVKKWGLFKVISLQTYYT